MPTNRSDILITAREKTSAAFGKVSSGLSRITSLVTGTAGKVAALAGVGGFGLLIKSSLDTVDALAKKSDQLGITTEKLQAMQHATSLFTSAGGPALSEALVKATKRLGEFNQTGGGAAAVWLKELNLDTQALAQLSPDQLFEQYANAIRGMNDRGKQMAAISALMGDESRRLIGLVDAGANVFDDAAKELDAFGVSINRVDAAKIELANDSWTKTKTLISGIGNSLSVALAPALTAINNKIIDVAKQSGGMSNFIQEGMSKVVTAIGWVLDIVNGLSVAFKGVQYVVAEMVAKVVENLNRLGKPIEAIVKLIPGIEATPFEVMDQVVKNLNENADKMLDNLDKAASAPPPSEAFKEGWKEIRYEIQKTAEATAKANQERNKLNQTGANAPQAKTDRTNEEKELQAARDRLDQINMSFMTERQLLDEHLAEKRLAIEGDYDQGYITAQERAQSLAILELQHQKDVTAIQQEEEEKRLRLAEQVEQDLQNMKQNTANLSINLLQMLGGKSKAAAIAAIALNKGLAIGRAIQNTGVAVTNALASVPYPANLGVAAQMKALGAIQVGLIAATGLAQAANVGGGGLGGGGGGGHHGGGIVRPTPTATPIEALQPSRTKVIIAGSQPGVMIDSAALAAALKEAGDSEEIIIQIAGERAEIF